MNSKYIQNKGHYKSEPYLIPNKGTSSQQGQDVETELMSKGD